MRGQKLFIRRELAGDVPALSALYQRCGCSWNPSSEPLEGLTGKLVGEVVAHLGMTRSGNILVVQSIVVDPPLRRKRIGRAMILEATRLAQSEGRIVSVTDDERWSSFFLKVGFEKGEGALVSRAATTR